jgi:hypothetical protein
MDLAVGTTHADSTTEASLARKVFSANALSPGKIFRFTGAFRVYDNNSTDTLVPRVRFGTTSATPASNTECGVGLAVDVADDDVFLVDGYLHVQTTTRAVIYGFLTDCDAEASRLVGTFFEILTIAADTQYYLDITADWSVAHADNEVQSEAWAVYEVV